MIRPIPSCILAGLLLVWLPKPCVAQSSSAPAKSPPVTQLTLRLEDTVPVTAVPAAPLEGLARCDGDGNVYLRFDQPADPMGAPVVRISADGEGVKVFSPPPIANLQGAEIDSFSVSPDGSVDLGLWGWDPQAKKGVGYIATLKDDGSLDHTTKVGAYMEPDQVAGFSSGQTLVSGTRDARIYGKDQPAVSVPFTEILDFAGNPAKTLTLPGDFQPAKPGDKDFKAQVYQEPAEITLGDAESGSDGNVYLMRHTGKPTVYVISPDGALLRTLHLAPPFPSASAGFTIRYGDGGRLALAFAEFVPGLQKAKVFKDMIISVYDAQTGERMVDYLVSPELGGDLVCYTSRGFTFLGRTPQHQLAIQRASAY